MALECFSYVKPKRITRRPPTHGTISQLEFNVPFQQKYGYIKFSPAKTDESIESLFRWVTRVGQRNVLDGAQIPQNQETIFGG